MKRSIQLVILCCTALLLSCEKDRQCECKNANGTYTAGQVKAGKMRAKKYCKSLSGPETDCYLK